MGFRYDQAIFILVTDTRWRLWGGQVQVLTDNCAFTNKFLKQGKWKAKQWVATSLATATDFWGSGPNKDQKSCVCAFRDFFLFLVSENSVMFVTHFLKLSSVYTIANDWTFAFVLLLVLTFRSLDLFSALFLFTAFFRTNTIYMLSLMCLRLFFCALCWKHMNT